MGHHNLLVAFVAVLSSKALSSSLGRGGICCGIITIIFFYIGCLILMLITVSDQGLTGLTIRCQCYRSMRKSQPPVRESHHTGSVQVPEKTTVLYLSSID